MIEEWHSLLFITLYLSHLLKSPITQEMSVVALTSDEFFTFTMQSHVRVELRLEGCFHIHLL